MAKYRKWERSLEYLREIIEEFEKPHFFGVLDHVSASGLTRHITVFVIIDNKPVIIAREYKIGGCGFDALHHYCYHLMMQLDYEDPLHSFSCEWL